MTKNAEKMFSSVLFAVVCLRSRKELLVNANFELFYMNLDPYFQ